MTPREIEDLRARVPCTHLLEHQSWLLDIKESTARAPKYRRGPGEIVIVIHGGKGWFDPLSDAKGDVFSLAQHLLRTGFAEAAAVVAGLVGFVPHTPTASVNNPKHRDVAIADRWHRRVPPSPGSPGWRYLNLTRCLPDTVIRAAIDSDLLREGPAGSIWAAHVDDDGQVLGWEERGPTWRGFSTGGSKSLFRLGAAGVVSRLCVTEAAIDAMSLAAIEGMPAGTLYLSTGGGWSPATSAALARLLETGAVLVAATDDDRQGDIYGERLRQMAERESCGFERLKPRHSDWNHDLTSLAGGSLAPLIQLAIEGERKKQSG